MIRLEHAHLCGSLVGSKYCTEKIVKRNVVFIHMYDISAVYTHTIPRINKISRSRRTTNKITRLHHNK